ncbi:hypothetical protein GETHPA_10470 [Geothrix rubra]|uniref:Uncharacterized protein n=1 Tax=Geothrix rubra TaxID=2927977 RepID=A0ABQ5Q4T7_9BACT|nr:hypothetical protein GETHPA_10470 [Geothrix rubra]
MMSNTLNPVPMLAVVFSASAAPIRETSRAWAVGREG